MIGYAPKMMLKSIVCYMLKEDEAVCWVISVHASTLSKVHAEISVHETGNEHTLGDC